MILSIIGLLTNIVEINFYKPEQKQNLITDFSLTLSIQTVYSNYTLPFYYFIFYNIYDI